MTANHLKIAICSDSINPDAIVSNRFARCDYYGIYDHKTLSFEFVGNNAKEEMSGAGGKAAAFIADLDIDVALVPEIGPKAFEALQAFGISIYKYDLNFTVRDAVYAFYENKLPEVHASTKKGKH